MAILAASVCTKQGKILVSRQFLDLPRSRIEGLMASFPKLVLTVTQHTTVDTDDVRFVYQPIDDLYLILTTSKLSNILQDIASLHLFARIISEQCRTVNEREVVDHAFELITSFDEIISLGYRENINLMQLRAIINMESNEERIQEMIKKNKELEAKEQSRLKAKQLEIQRKQMAKLQSSTMSPMMSSIPGFGNVSQPMNSFTFSSNTPPPSMPSYANSATPLLRSTNDSSTIKMGMKLGTTKRDNNIADVFGGITPTPSVAAELSVSTSLSVTPTVQPKDPVHLIIDEHICAIVNRDGGLQSMEVKGDLSIHVTQTGSPANARVHVILPTDLKGVQFKTHPNMDKKAWTDSQTLILRDASKTYPIGQPSGVLKWRYVGTNEDCLPISINCWPNPTPNGQCVVNIEYELIKMDLTLTNVVLAVPLPQSALSNNAQPLINQVDGKTVVDRARGLMLWQIDMISADHPSGTLDLTAATDAPSAFFPINVHWGSSQSLYCPVTIDSVVGSDNEPIEFGMTRAFIPDEYKIV